MVGMHYVAGVELMGSSDPPKELGLRYQSIHSTTNFKVIMKEMLHYEIMNRF